MALHAGITGPEGPIFADAPMLAILRKTGEIRR
jgi:hypothetical protein